MIGLEKKKKKLAFLRLCVHLRESIVILFNLEHKLNMIFSKSSNHLKTGKS